MDAGYASGWNVWQLDDGDWAWRVWAVGDVGFERSGVQPTEAAARQAADRELELITAEARASAQSRRELPSRDRNDTYREPRAAIDTPAR